MVLSNLYYLYSLVLRLSYIFVMKLSVIILKFVQFLNTWANSEPRFCLCLVGRGWEVSITKNKELILFLSRDL